MMELINAVEGSPICSDRLAPQIGPNHQVTMPPLKQSARIASLEYINRDQWYACGLPVPIMHIAPAPSLQRKKSSRSLADQDKSLSLASTSNSRTNGIQPPDAEQQKIPCAEAMMGNKDVNSCASSNKETCQAWKKEESSSLTLVDAILASQQQQAAEEKKAEAMVVEDLLPGVSGQSELKSSITSLVQASFVIKKKKKRRSCWQTLKRKGNNKKAKIEKGKPYKRWSGLLYSEVGEASGQGSAGGGWGGGGDEGREGRGRVLPGCQPDSWSEEEVAGFTLALYLFDKDFCAIKRFLATKKMKDILHFYYGKFYGTPAFCRWAGSKNSRNRKCVHGPRILQGWRQDELLRRLLPHFPDSSLDVIHQAVKSFNEREMTVEGLASGLKAAVGMETLVHCVGIGVPKRDLTAVHGDPANKHGNHHHLAAGGGGGGARGGMVENRGGAAGPGAGAGAAAAGKACSSLSKEEMLECLTGNFRISKTRAQDLFWEAVWPRLLANGWHSTEYEAPAGFPGSRSTLAFLRPGVAKIARGSSERGVHYFDSVSEVLKAVANDPGLLDGGSADELTGDTMEGSENHEEDEDEDVEVEEEDEDVHEEEWSDDMFETLDMHRLRGPLTGKTTGAGVKSAKAAFKAAAASSSSPSPSPSPSPSEEEEHAAQDSSESSSVDIDLNRPLSVVSSKPPEPPKVEEEVANVELRSSASVQAIVSHNHHHHRFPIEEIDLNLPPLDLDCNSPVRTPEGGDGEVQLERQTAFPVVNGSRSPIPKAVEKNVGEVLESKTWDPCPVVTHTVMAAASIERGSASVMGTINLNDPSPAVDTIMMQDAGLKSTEQSRLGEEQEQYATMRAGLRSIWPAGSELVPFDRYSSERRACERPQLLNKNVSCACGVADSCKCQSRKRSLSYQENEAAAAARGGDFYGKELIPFSKKRAIAFELPFRLNGLDTPNFIFSMHVATMNAWVRLGIQPLLRTSDWRQDWNIRVSPPSAVVPFRVEVENFARSTESQLPKCKVVEVNGDVDAVNTETHAAENEASEGHLQKSLSTGAPPLAGQYGHVKRLRCHFSESEPLISPSFSRSKLQRLPRKYTISFDSRSSKSRLLKAKERCSDWSWPQDARNSKNVVDTLSCCSTSHAIPSADSPDRQCASEKCREEGVNSKVFDHGSQSIKGNDCDPRRRRAGDGERFWNIPSVPLSNEEGDAEDIRPAKSLPRDWKVPCLTLTAPGDSCDFDGFRRLMPRSRGIRSHHGRSHSHPAKSFDKDFLSLSMGTKRFPNVLEELDTTKKTKMDTSDSLRRREMTEEDVLETLCSMQEQRLEGRITSSVVIPKLKGKRSSRLRRRNFRDFPQFIFEGLVEEEEVEEAFFVQPCTSQGPWQPTLPTTEKISRSPKLRRRRSGLPCKGSCVVVATSPIVSELNAGNSSKAQLGSRLPGQSPTGEEEVTTSWNWPIHDVRFSLRRQLSDGPSRTDRQSGRKVPARWNLVC